MNLFFIKENAIMSRLMFMLILITMMSVSISAYSATNDASWFTTGSKLDIDVDPSSQGDIYTWDGEWLVGSDFNKLAILTEGQSVNSKATDASVQMLYSRNIARFWDARIGVRQLIDPSGQSSGVLSIAGLAPYYFDVDGSVYFNRDGVSSEFKLAYDVQITQKLISEFYNNSTWNGFEKSSKGIGKGLAFVQTGMRLRYEFNRHFGLYIDFYTESNLNKTADFMRQSGESTRGSGVRFGARVFNF